jgi:transposase
MSDELCGAETTKGGKCQNKAESCPWHNTDDPPENGRDSKLSKEREEQIAQAIENGRSMTAAARMAGVSRNAVYSWIEKGEQQEEGIYADFHDRITRARGQGEEWYFQTAMRLAKENGDHRFIASLMKQRYPDSWQDAETGVEADTVEIVLDGEKSRYEPTKTE